jgi:hypothetical protein
VLDVGGPLASIDLSIGPLADAIAVHSIIPPVAYVDFAI